MKKITYGTIHTLTETIENVESWNLSSDESFTLEKGQKIKVLRVYDSHHTTVEFLDLKSEKCIHHPAHSSAYRFIVNNIHLSDSINIYIPTITQDPIGELINNY